MPKLPALTIDAGDFLRLLMLPDAIRFHAIAAYFGSRMLMHCSPRYGYLSENGQSPMLPSIAAQRVGTSEQEWTALLAELETRSLVDKSRNGIIFDKVMVGTKRARGEPRSEGKNGDMYLDSKDFSLEVKNLKPASRSKTIPPPGFAQFWELYPKKLDKKEAEKVWNRIEPVLGEVLAGLAHWKLCQQWTDYDHIPYPATFLNKERWKETPEALHATSQKVVSEAYVGTGPRIEDYGIRVNPEYLEKVRKRDEERSRRT